MSTPSLVGKMTKLPPPIPWNSPASIGVKRRGDLDFAPEVVSATLNEAIDIACDPEAPRNRKLCIWVTWAGRSVQLQGVEIVRLSRDPSRPPSPPRS
jgi:hypothetical protein